VIIKCIDAFRRGLPAAVWIHGTSVNDADLQRFAELALLDETKLTSL